METLNIIFRPGLFSWGCRINGKRHRSGSIHIQGNVIKIKAMVRILAQFTTEDIQSSTYENNILTLHSKNGDEVQLKVKENDAKDISRCLSLGIEINPEKRKSPLRFIFYILFWPYGLLKLWKAPHLSTPIKTGVTTLFFALAIFGFMLESSDYAKNSSESILMVKRASNDTPKKIGFFSTEQTIKLWEKEKMPNTWEATIYFLVKKDAKTEADGCVEYYSTYSKYDSVFCFGFTNHEAYKFSIAGPDGMENLCYKASSHLSLSGSRGGVADNSEMLNYACPQITD